MTTGELLDRPARRQRGATAPLSYAQESLWYLDRLAPGVPAFQSAMAVWLRGPLDADALRAALTALVARHEPLRTALREAESGPLHAVTPPSPVRLPVTDLAGADVAARRARGRVLAQDLARRPFDLAGGRPWRAALYRVDRQEHLFVWVAHDMAFDPRSRDVLAAELSELYAAGTAGRPPDLPEVGPSYADFAVWQRDRLGGSRMDDLVGYWRDKLRNLSTLELPADRPRPAELSFRGATARHPVSGAAVAGAHRLAAALGCPPHVVYLAAFVAVLHRYSGQDDLAVGWPVSLRDGPDLTGLIGCFTNLTVVRVDAGGEPTFRALVRRVDAATREAAAHADLPFAHVVQAVAPVRQPSLHPLVQVAFLPQTSRRPVRLPGLDAEVEPLAPRTARLDLTCQVVEDGEHSTVEVEYGTDRFDPETVEHMQTHYVQLLANAVAEPDRPVGRVPMLAPGEREELLRRWDGPRRPVPDTSVDRWFAEQAARTPDAIAVTAGESRLTYAALDERANRLAWLLRARGVEPGDRVALRLPRGLDNVVAVLAVLKAGAAFVPLDPAYPADRTATLLGDAGPRVLVTLAALAGGQPADGPAVVRLDEVGAEVATQPGHHPPATAAPDDLAYVLYTSGSTGAPKGVLIEHRNVVNFIGSVQRLFDLTPADRVLGYASHVFDVSVFEMFSALLTGARLCVALDVDRLDTDRLQRLMVDAAVTVIDLPPSVMGLLDPSHLTDLRIAFVGGEAFPGELVNRWNAVARFFNGYGPTECTVTMIVHECPGRWDGSPPIGLPMANHVAHVLDDNLELVPYGVPGELVIGGAGLARGYLDAPELTRAKFVPDPFGTAPGGRLYRTGDLVKRRRDGALVFLGRVDRQIKVRGIRIEPGEIEAALAAEPGVRQAYVQAWSGRRGQQHLVAYVGAPGEHRPTAGELRSGIATRLPAAMVPRYIVVLPELPLTASGKVDRGALPPPEPASQDGPSEITAPRTTTERILAEELVGPALRLPVVDVRTSIFELGGDSLRAARIVAAAGRRFEVDVALAEFVREPSVAGLAVLVEREQDAAGL